MTANGLNRQVPGAREWTSYQRLVTALHHREPDRVPFDLGGSMVTGINVRALTALRWVLGLPGEAPEVCQTCAPKHAFAQQRKMTVVRNRDLTDSLPSGLRAFGNSARGRSVIGRVIIAILRA